MSLFEKSPLEYVADKEMKKNVLVMASLYSLSRNTTLTIAQFVAAAYNDLDLKDALKEVLSLDDDMTLFRTLLYMNFVGEPLKPKSLYRVFRNGRSNK